MGMPKKPFTPQKIRQEIVRLSNKKNDPFVLKHLAKKKKKEFWF